MDGRGASRALSPHLLLVSPHQCLAVRRTLVIQGEDVAPVPGTHDLVRGTARVWVRAAWGWKCHSSVVDLGCGGSGGGLAAVLAGLVAGTSS